MIKSNQILLGMFLVLFLSLIFFLGSSFLIEPEVIEVYPPLSQVSESFPAQTQLPENKTITLILVGDIMLNRGVEYQIKNNNDWRWPFLKIADDSVKADILFGNLEGPISDKGRKVGSIYSFRNDPKAIEGLTFAGFNVLSLANNHVFDYGSEALEDSFKRLKEAGIDYVGGGFNEKEAFSPVIKKINDTKIGILAYTNLGPRSWRATQTNSGIAWISENDFEKIKKDIEKAKKRANILIVSFHSGEEYLSEPTQFQIEFSRAAIEAGADIVIGHHPHVIQKKEKYKNGWIFYSLGNFVFDQSFSEETMKGQIIKVLLENGKIKEVIPINIKINNFFQPQIEK